MVHHINEHEKQKEKKKEERKMVWRCGAYMPHSTNFGVNSLDAFENSKRRVLRTDSRTDADSSSGTN